MKALKYVKKLEGVGFSKEQAEMTVDIFGEIIEGNLSTKQDIHLLQRDVYALKNDMKVLEANLKYDLTIRLGSMLIAAIGAIAALITILPKVL